MITLYVVATRRGRIHRDGAELLAFTSKRKAQKAARAVRGCVVTMHGDMPPLPTMLEVARKRRPKDLDRIINELFSVPGPLTQAMRWKPVDGRGEA